MVNISQHKVVMVKVLKAIYTDKLLQTMLGFKGGTAAMLIYDLPRFSIDLDFDLLKVTEDKRVFSRLQKILTSIGQVQDAREKYYTLFFLLNYQKRERNLKIEISRRPSLAQYQLKNYLGISMLVMSKSDMFASKLAAYLTRPDLATRDLFDLWFFFSSGWLINPSLFKEKTGMVLQSGLEKAITKTETIKNKQLLAGLGELLNNKQKDWVRTKLKDELLFQIRLYLDNASRFLEKF